MVLGLKDIVSGDRCASRHRPRAALSLFGALLSIMWLRKNEP